MKVLAVGAEHAEEAAQRLGLGAVDEAHDHDQ